MAVAIYPLNFFYSNRNRVAITCIITREISANSNVRGKYANAIHTLERSIIGHPLSVQLRLHFLHSLTVVDKESEFDNIIDSLHIQKFALYREIL